MGVTPSGLESMPALVAPIRRVPGSRDEVFVRQSLVRDVEVELFPDVTEWWMVRPASRLVAFAIPTEDYASAVDRTHQTTSSRLAFPLQAGPDGCA